MERALVTGAAGFVGSVLVPHLLQEGYLVRALDRFTHRGTPGLAACCGHPNLEVIKGDVRDSELLRSCLKDVHTIIPLAAIVGAPACNLDKNAAETINWGAIVRLACLKTSEQRLLYPNTNSGYGTTKHGEVCTENTPLKPISHYGLVKKEAEDFILTMSNCCSFRFATAFGASPRHRTDLLVNDFVYRAVKDRFVMLFESQFRRNYIHVRDIARVFVHAMRNWDKFKQGVFNVGLPDTLTKGALCYKIEQHIPNFVWHEDDFSKDPDKRDYEVSNEKLYSRGFTPLFDLDYGVKELINLYKMLPPGEYANA